MSYLTIVAPSYTDAVRELDTFFQNHTTTFISSISGHISKHGYTLKVRYV